MCGLLCGFVGGWVPVVDVAGVHHLCHLLDYMVVLPVGVVMNEHPYL